MAKKNPDTIAEKKTAAKAPSAPQKEPAAQTGKKKATPVKKEEIPAKKETETAKKPNKGKPQAASKTPNRAAKGSKTERPPKEMPDAKEVTRDESYNRVAFIEKAQAHKTERETYNAEKEMNFAVLSRIRDAMHKKEIVQGVIAGVSEIAGGVSAITFFEGKKVLIPYQDVYMNSKLTVSPNETKESVMRRQKQILQTIVGCEVDYVIMDAVFIDHDPSQDVIRGSRVEALKRLQRRHYDAENMRPGTIHVEAGNIYKGKIISLGNWGCRINVYGVDVQLRAADMTYRPIEDLRKLYAPGEDIDVYIREVKKGEDGYEIVASCKIAELEQYRKNISRATIGDMMIARVSAVNTIKDEKGNRSIPRASLFIDAIKMPAFASIIKSDGMRRPLRPGDSVLFRIDGISPNQPILTGAITRILDNRPTMIRFEN